MRVDDVVKKVDAKVDVKLLYDIDCLFFLTSLSGLYLYSILKSYNHIRLGFNSKPNRTRT